MSRRKPGRPAFAPPRPHREVDPDEDGAFDEALHEPVSTHPADTEPDVADNDPMTGLPTGVEAVVTRTGPKPPDGRRQTTPQRRWEGCDLFPSSMYPYIRASAGDPAYIRVSKARAEGQYEPYNARGAKKSFDLDLTIEGIGNRWGNGKYVVELWSAANATHRTERLFRRTLEIEDADDYFHFDDGDERKFFPTKGESDPSLMGEEDEGPEDYPRMRRPRGGDDYGPDEDDYGPPRIGRDGRPVFTSARERENSTPALIAAVSPIVTAMMQASAQRDTAQAQIAAQIAAQQQAAQQATMQMMMQMQQSSQQMMVAMMSNAKGGGDEVTRALLAHTLAQKSAPPQNPLAAAAETAAQVEKLRDVFGGDAPEEGGFEGILMSLAKDPQKLAMVAQMIGGVMGGGQMPPGQQPPMPAHVQQQPPPMPVGGVHVASGMPGVPPDPQMPGGDG